MSWQFYGNIIPISSKMLVTSFVHLSIYPSINKRTHPIIYKSLNLSTHWPSINIPKVHLLICVFNYFNTYICKMFVNVLWSMWYTHLRLEIKHEYPVFVQNSKASKFMYLRAIFVFSVDQRKKYLDYKISFYCWCKMKQEFVRWEENCQETTAIRDHP